MTLDEIIQFLSDLPNDQFRAVLEAVFKVKQPSPGIEDAVRNKVFLGAAYCPEIDKEEYRVWEIAAVAYPDPATYASYMHPLRHRGFYESGTCSGCGVEVASNVKRGICPICETTVYMT